MGKIYIATHKKYKMPDNKLYEPIQAGRKIIGDIGYLGDDTGDSISERNKNYSELTALYWIWKNIQEDYVGLVHYRRYFTKKNKMKIYFKRDKNFLAIGIEEVKEILGNFDIIVPKIVNMRISVYDNYKNDHVIKDLKLTRDIISFKYPEYIESFDRVVDGNKIYLFNMFITKKDIMNEYCEWLFDILFELEKRVDILGYDDYQKRI